MNIQEPFKISNIDVNKIVYPKHKLGQNKKIILIKYNEKGKLRNFVFQTPTLLNISKVQTINNYSEIEVGLVGKEEGKVDRFISFLNALEDKIKADVKINASSWFNINNNNNNNNNVINFQKIIRESDDHKNGTIKVKIINNTNFETVLKLENNKRIDIDSIPEDSWCKMILECYAIWINSSNDFGIFLRPILISFTPKEKEFYQYRFIEDSEDDNEFDVPDTEINHNIFMRLESSKESFGDINSTSILELDKSLRLGHTEIDNTESIVNHDKVLEINLGRIYNSISDSEESSNDSDINNDAETSDD